MSNNQRIKRSDAEWEALFRAFNASGLPVVRNNSCLDKDSLTSRQPLPERSRRNDR